MSCEVSSSSGVSLTLPTTGGGHERNWSRLKGDGELLSICYVCLLVAVYQ